MVLVNIVQELIAIVEGVMGHFVSGAATSFTQQVDHEWAMTAGTYTLTSKGQFLSGAVADIAVYGAILVDWLIQAMMAPTTPINIAYGY